MANPVPSSRRLIALIMALYALAGLLLARAECGPSPDDVSLSAGFTIDPRATDHYEGASYPGTIFVPLGTESPKGIMKEPPYRTTPRYSAVRIGDRPEGTFFLAVDEPEGEAYKL